MVGNVRALARMGGRADAMTCSNAKRVAEERNPVAGNAALAFPGSHSVGGPDAPTRAVVPSRLARKCEQARGESSLEPPGSTCALS
jgi:hypothetical protein